MLTQPIQFLRLLITTAALTTLMSSTVRGDAPAKPKKTQPAKPQQNKPRQAVPTLVLPLVIPNFIAASDAQIAKLRDDLEEQQAYLKVFLLLQLEDEKLSHTGRVETIGLLSKFPPSEEIINALIQNIDVIAYERAEQANNESRRYRGYIARLVLAQIGPHAEKEILDRIGQPEPTPAQLENAPSLRDLSFDPAKVEGYGGVLSRIHDKEGAIALLRAAQAKAENPTIKAQFQKVIEAVEKEQPLVIKY